MVNRLQKSAWIGSISGEAPEETRRSIEMARDNRLWFLDNLTMLRRRHLNKWVAIRSRRVIAEHRDYKGLVAQLRSALKDFSDVEIEFVAPEDTQWILHWDLREDRAYIEIPD